jgi:hypothetical protein
VDAKAKQRGGAVASVVEADPRLYGLLLVGTQPDPIRQELVTVGVLTFNLAGRMAFSLRDHVSANQLATMPRSRQGTGRWLDAALVARPPGSLGTRGKPPRQHIYLVRRELHPWRDEPFVKAVDDRLYATAQLL